MKIHNKHGGVVTFRHHVGDGEINGLRFTLGVSMAGDGTLLGMPVFAFDDPERTIVTLELSDLLPLAIKAAGLDV